MNHCLLCHQPIRKQHGDESKPAALACWIHTTGYYNCPGARSEYDLATYDPAEGEQEVLREVLAEDRLEDTPPEDYCI